MANHDASSISLEPMQLACDALLQALRGPDLMGRLQALAHRLDNGLDTSEDRRLLAELPKCRLAPVELVRLFVRVEEEACAHH